jgi:CRISPR-associated protein Cas2
MRHHIVVAYDISDPTRLRRVARVVSDFGDRLQLSVFVCQLSKKDLAILKQRLIDIVSRQEDQIVFMNLGPVRDATDDAVELDYVGRKPALSDLRGLIF